MFNHLAEDVRKHGYGVRAYETCARATAEAIQKHPDLASAYFLLGMAAARFVERFEAQPLSKKTAEKHVTLFEDFTKRLSVAFETENDSTKLDALNQVAKDILNFGR